AFFENFPAIHRVLTSLCDVGLGYLSLGQSSTSLSGGESQRIKLATELARTETGRTLYLLDEPTTGLHFDDIRQLLAVLQRLVDRGNTAIVIELNDGSSLANLQIVADGSLPNYETEVKHLTAGSSVAIEGEVKPSGGKGQATEVLAKKLTILGGADPEAYPLQKKQHSLEKLREWAHLRPRTNTFGAVTRVRNCVS